MEQYIEIEKIPKNKYDMKYFEIDVSLIKYITKLVRSTFEYKEFIQILKNYLNVNKCAYYEGYSMKNGFTLEIHHSPFTLYDICEVIANKQMSNNKYIETFKVCEEVTELHFQFKVGLVPLNPTAHELVHSGALTVHPDLVLGSWKEFVEEYKSFMSNEIYNKYLDIIQYEKDNDPSKFPNILKQTDIKLKLPDNIKSLKELDLDNLIIDQKIKLLQ